jgi:hypothetical protein
VPPVADKCDNDAMATSGGPSPAFVLSDLKQVKFAVHPKLFGDLRKGKKSPIERALASAFDSALEEIRQGLEVKLLGTGAGHPTAVFGQAQIRATPKQAMRLRAQVEGLMKKVRRESRDQGDPYRVLIVSYPLIPPHRRER